LTNFSNDKQTQECLESAFQKTTFHETNRVLIFKNVFRIIFYIDELYFGEEKKFICR
jgi:hypothetical protein